MTDAYAIAEMRMLLNRHGHENWTIASAPDNPFWNAWIIQDANGKIVLTLEQRILYRTQRKGEPIRPEIDRWRSVIADSRTAKGRHDRSGPGRNTPAASLQEALEWLRQHSLSERRTKSQPDAYPWTHISQPYAGSKPDRHGGRDNAAQTMTELLERLQAKP